MLDPLSVAFAKSYDCCTIINVYIGDGRRCEPLKLAVGSSWTDASPQWQLRFGNYRGQKGEMGQ